MDFTVGMDSLVCAYGTFPPLVEPNMYAVRVAGPRGKWEIERKNVRLEI